MFPALSPIPRALPDEPEAASSPMTLVTHFAPGWGQNL